MDICEVSISKLIAHMLSLVRHAQFAVTIIKLKERELMYANARLVQIIIRKYRRRTWVRLKVKKRVTYQMLKKNGHKVHVYIKICD